ncbi:hypothetical protein ABK040_001818 [Willaertia magna]
MLNQLTAKWIAFHLNYYMSNNNNILSESVIIDNNCKINNLLQILPNNCKNKIIKYCSIFHLFLLEKYLFWNVNDKYYKRLFKLNKRKLKSKINLIENYKINDLKNDINYKNLIFNDLLQKSLQNQENKIISKKIIKNLFICYKNNLNNNNYNTNFTINNILNLFNNAITKLSITKQFNINEINILLNKLPNLETIEFRDLKTNELLTINNLTNIKNIYFFHCNFNDESILNNFLKNLKNKQNDEDLDMYDDLFIEENKFIKKSFTFKSINLFESNCDALGGLLLNSPNMEVELNFSFNEIDSNMFIKIVRSIPYMSIYSFCKITKLIITENNLDNLFLEYLINNFISIFRYLKYLDLTNNNFTGMNFINLLFLEFNKIKINNLNINLTYLNISHNNLGDEDNTTNLNDIYLFLKNKNNFPLKYLILNHCELNNYQLDILFNGMKENNHIKVLDVSNNYYIDNNYYLLNLINYNNCLERISLNGIFLNDINLNNIINNLINNNNLNYIDLSGNRFLDKYGIDLLNNYFKKLNKKLLVFDLSMNRLTDDFANVFIEILNDSNCKFYIQRFYLENNFFTKEMNLKLREISLQSGKIKNLILSNTYMDDSQILAQPCDGITLT